MSCIPKLRIYLNRAFKVQIENEAKAFNIRSFSQRGGRGQVRGTFRRGQDRRTTNNKEGCPLCKSYGFTCNVLNSIKKKDKGIEKETNQRAESERVIYISSFFFRIPL